MRFSRTLLLAGLKLTGAGSTLIATSLIARWFGADALGTFGLVMTLTAIWALVGSFGSPVFLMTHRAHGIRSAEARAASLAGILILSCVIAPVLAFQAPNQIWAGFMAAAVVAWALVQAAGAILVSDSKFMGNSCISDLIRPSIPLFALLAHWSASKGTTSSLNTFATVAAMLFALLGLGCAFYIWPRELPLCSLFRPEIRSAARALANVGFSALPIALVALLGGQADRLYLSRIVPIGELGVYVAGQTVVGLVTHFLTAILVQRTPAMVESLRRSDYEDVARLSKGVSRASAAFALVALAVVIPAAPLLGAFFGLPGKRVAIVGGILLLGMGLSMLFGTGTTLMTYEGSKGRIRLLLLLGASLVSSIVVGVMLTSAIGIYGAALGTAIGTLLQRFLPFVHYWRRGISLLAIGRGGDMAALGLRDSPGYGRFAWLVVPNSHGSPGLAESQDRPIEIVGDVPANPI